MTSRQTLSALRTRAKESPDQALVHWYVTEDESSTHVNLRNVRLLVLVDGQLHAMPGTVTRDPDFGQQLLFASKGLCRIANGRRRGMIVEPHRLRVGEDAKTTGLVKSLLNGSRSNSLRLSDDRDRMMVSRIDQAFAEAVELTELIQPTCYIRAKAPVDLTLRLSGDVTKQLMDLAEYDKALPMEDNFHNLIGTFATQDDAGNNLYPFDMVAGPGLVVMDMSNAPPPLLVPKSALGLKHKLLRIEL
jgi:hypothetical protein